MTTALGPLEMRFLAYCQARNRQSIAAGEFVGALGWTAEQERNVLSRLARKGFISRIRPGLYLVPPRLPPGGRWSPGEFLALSTLMGDRDGRYQLSGLSLVKSYKHAVASPWLYMLCDSIVHASSV
jgi:predicted transcriptional regulator of viral defense system